VWGGVSPPKSGGRVWRYNLKLISTLYNDSIPETPSEKSGVYVSTPVHPVATPLSTPTYRDKAYDMQMSHINPPPVWLPFAFYAA